MLNLPELEKRWFRYKVKSVLPYILIALLFIIISAYTILVLNNQKTKHTIIIPEKTVIQVSQIKQNTLKAERNRTNTVLVPNIKTQVKVNNVETNTSQIAKLSPSMDFLNNFQLENETYEHQITKQRVKSIKKPKNSIKKIQPSSQEKENIISNITIIKQDTKKDIQNILLRFQKDKNPALSLFLAKKYYEIGDYHQAYNYALITNRMNKEIEESWLIFAKSLVKLHKKNKAIGILSKYIKNTHSSNAEILLQEIHSGTFK